jgi:predicted transcriptional regulator
VNSTTYPEQPGFKTNGTSQEAAHNVTPKAERLRDQCLVLLQTKGARTADEISTVLDETPFNIRPRVTELFKQGKIEKTGLRRPGLSGASMIVWKAVELL